MTTPRRLASVLLACLLAAGACSGSSDDSEAGGPNGATTTAPAGDADGNGPSSTSGGDNEDSDAAGDLTTTPTQPTPEGVDASKPVERDDLPKPGTYGYTFTVKGGDPSQRRFDVQRAGEGDGWARQLFTLRTDSFLEARLVVWVADQHYVEVEQRARGASAAPPCAWSPGIIQLRLPLPASGSWKGDSTCETETSTRRRVSDVRVTGTETVEIGGTSVEAVALRRSETTTTNVKTQPVIIVDKAVTTELVWRQRGLLLRSSGTQSSTLNGVPQDSFEFTNELNSLEPETSG